MIEVMSMQKVKVRGQRSKSQRSNPIYPFPDRNSSTKLDVARERCSIDFQGHLLNFKVTRLKNCQF